MVRWHWSARNLISASASTQSDLQPCPTRGPNNARLIRDAACRLHVCTARSSLRVVHRNSSNQSPTASAGRLLFPAERAASFIHKARMTNDEGDRDFYFVIRYFGFLKRFSPSLLNSLPTDALQQPLLSSARDRCALATCPRRTRR